jgi:putative DNA primase/helicase
MRVFERPPRQIAPNRLASSPRDGSRGTTADLHRLKRQLGGEIFDDGRRWLGPGPGHRPRDRSLSVWITDDGRVLIQSFAGDDFRACAQHTGLFREELLAPARRRPRGPAKVSSPDSAALSIWRGARPNGEIVRTYLSLRGITLPLPPTLRQGMTQAAGGSRHPMMVAAVQASDGRIVAVQRTLLTTDGRRRRSLRQAGA